MNKKAFTLIELIVGITISMILMVSVGVFISGGMKNIFLQQKILENTDRFTDFAGNLHTSFNLMQSGSIIELTASGIIFKRGQNYGEGGFTYIGEIESLIIDGDGIYCLSGSEDVDTNHIIIKNFIPFEEENENIFTSYTGSLTASGGTSYTSYQKEHIIKDSSGNDIVGKGIFGDKFEEGAYGTGIYLNSPTGLAKSGSILFISDTLNNRILYYDTSTSLIYKLLDETDGLNEPTGLYYDNNSSLYIANSGNGEILKYSSKSSGTPSELTMSGFTEDINEIYLSFSGSNSVNLTNTGTWTIIGNSSNPDYLTGATTNKLEYYFVSYGGINNETDCDGKSNGDIIFNGNKPHIYCTQSGSGQTASYPTSAITEIKIDNLNDFSATGSYYVNLKLFDGTTEKYSEYFPYFTQSDNDLTTPKDNILEVYTGGLNYPTGIWENAGIKYNEFGKSGRIDSSTILNYHTTDNLLKTPIKELNITNTANDLISLVLKYYKSYNCYNLDDKIERTFLLNKNLK